MQYNSLWIKASVKRFNVVAGFLHSFPTQTRCNVHFISQAALPLSFFNFPETHLLTEPVYDITDVKLVANTKTSLPSETEKKNRPTSKIKPLHHLKNDRHPKSTSKVLPAISADCGSSTGDPVASKPPSISVARRRVFLRCLFNHLNARLMDAALLLPRLPLPPCLSSLNTCSISGGIRSPTDSRPDDIVQPATKTDIIQMSHCFCQVCKLPGH